MRASCTARLRLDGQGVHPKHHGLVLRVARPEHVAKSATPVPAGTARGHREVPPPGQRFKFEEDPRLAVAHVLVLHPLQRPRLGQPDLVHLADALLDASALERYKGGVAAGLGPPVALAVVRLAFSCDALCPEWQSPIVVWFVRDADIVP